MDAPLSDSQIALILARGMSPRAKRIDTYQRYFDGSIYDGKPDFLDISRDEPFNERKPCVIYPGVRNAVESFTSMCVGEGRFPTITSLTSEDDSELDPRFGLNEADSKTLDAGIKKINAQSRLPAVSVQLLERALNSGTACPLVSVQDGRLKVTELDPKNCTPTFEADGETCAKVEVSYRYVDDVQNDKGEWEKRVYQYRRVIDKELDTVYEPVEIRNENDRPIPTKEKKGGKYRHGFGFCPVHWYRFLDVTSDASAIDGRPIHWGLASLCDSINFGLSQRHGAAMYSGDPQLCESGVEEDAPVRAPQGRIAGPQTQTGDPSGWNFGPAQTRAGQRRGRKKGKGSVWTYESPDSKAWYLTLPPGALEALAKDADDNIARLRESLGHVYIDPKDLAGSGDVSGKTLAFVYANQVAKCNRIREDFGAKCLLPVLNMLFRVALQSGDGLYLQGLKKIRPILEKFLVDVQVANDSQDSKGTTKRWFAPTLKLVWGDYFETSDQDEATRTDVATKAKDAGLITRQTAVEHIKPIFKGIDNVPQYVKTLEEEVAKNKADSDASLHGAINALNQTGGDENDDGDGSDAGGDSTPAGDGTTGASASRGSPATSATDSNTAVAAMGAKSLSDQGLSSPAKGAAKGQPKPATKPLHDRSISTAGVAESVYRQLAEDFPEDAIAWVRAASWTGPQDVPLVSIDYSNRDEWKASQEPERVQFFVEKIKAGDKKPIVLVNEPNNRKAIIVDGHHRALAYEKLGMPAYAYVADVGNVTGPWDVLHDSQKDTSKLRRKPSPKAA
jgi:hypothetical protein